MDMVDTSKDMGKGMLSLYNRLITLILSGYIQPQFQVAEGKGAKGFAGGDFTANSIPLYVKNGTPGIIVSGNEGYYVRKFIGAFFYFLQNPGSARHRLE